MQRLVRIPSLPGEERDAHLAAADAMRALGLDVAIVSATRDELAAHPAFCDDGLPVDTRINVVGRWRAPERRAGARSIILNGHLDVVSPGSEARWSASPWSGHVDGGRIFGRGACDMKAGVATALFAVAALRRLGLTPGAEVLVETVSGEESGGVGTLTTIARGYRADAALILEPTSLKLCPVQAGALTFRLTVRGRLAHGALKQSGVSAIDKLRPLLDAIDRLEQDRHRRFAHALFPNPTEIAPISVGIVRAGDWPSTVPNEAVAEGRYGVFPGESVPEARRALRSGHRRGRARRRVDAHRAAGGRVVRRTVRIGRDAARRSRSSPRSPPAHRAATGRDPIIEGVTYGSDLRLFTNHARMPAVLYGAGDVARAHSVDEFVEIDENPHGLPSRRLDHRVVVRLRTKSRGRSSVFIESAEHQPASPPAACSKGKHHEDTRTRGRARRVRRRVHRAAGTGGRA